MQFDRNTERYRPALRLARMIILNYSPDVMAGHEDLLAILFNMDQLFEQFVCLQLRHGARQHGYEEIRIRAQQGKTFWMRKQIRPDIMIEDYRRYPCRKMILDTKWKLPEASKPNDADLRQIFTYNLHFGADRGALIYPRCFGEEGCHGAFAQSLALPPGYEHNCEMYYVELFDHEGNLARDTGVRMLQDLMPAHE